MIARNLFLSASLIALVSAGVLETRVVLRQREQLTELHKRTAEADRLAAALRSEIDRSTLELETTERELEATPAPDPAVVLRRKETSDWLLRTKQLRRIFEESPAHGIPEMQWLTDEDWLRVARRASFVDEHATRKALGDVRTKAKEKFFAVLAPALRAFARTANGEPPASILALAPHFEATIDSLTLERYEIVRGKPNTGMGGPELVVREKYPIDPEYDSRSEMHAQPNGSYGQSGSFPPLAWIPDLQERMQKAIRAYNAANPGRRPESIVEALGYFTPPLEPAKIELIRRLEQERQP